LLSLFFDDGLRGEVWAEPLVVKVRRTQVDDEAENRLLVGRLQLLETPQQDAFTIAAARGCKPPITEGVHETTLLARRNTYCAVADVQLRRNLAKA